MQEQDANKFSRDQIKETDICIVGGGAAGISLAKALIGLNVRVLILESGDHFFHQQTQDLYDFENVGHPLRAQKGYISRNRYFGGSTNTWLGRSAPLHPEDYKKRDWIPNSGWPVAETDLAPYYDRTSKILKLPDPAHLYNGSWKKFLVAPPHNFPEHGGILPSVFLLAKKPANLRKAYGKELRKAGNIETILNANVTEVLTSENDKSVISLLVKTLKGNSFKVRAKNYVLACGGWENVRILLASKGCSGWGVGNRHGNLGRYYSEHPKILGSKFTPRIQTMKSPVMFWKRKVAKEGFVRIGFKLTPSMQEKHRLPNNYIELTYPQTLSDAIAQSEHFFNNLGFSKSSIHNFVKLAPYVFNLAESFERLLFNMPMKFEHVVMYTHMEQIPTRESRLMLSEQRDELGMPKLKVNLQISDVDKENLKRFHKVAGEILERNGWGTLQSDLPEIEQPWPSLTDSSHHIGTTRMSKNPEDGVVDANCKVHGINNLFIAGSSIFPTGGHVNPTFSIVAFSLRLADHLKEVHGL